MTAPLATWRCRCGAAPVVFAAQDSGGARVEAALCMACARLAGWPWLVPERMSRRRAAEAPTVRRGQGAFAWTSA